VDAEFVRELFTQFGSVSLRRMFGGAGIYADGLMFGLITSDVIYLKADEDTGHFKRERCAPFSFKTKAGRRVLTSYWRLPDRLYDDPEELARWARRAYACAVAAQSAKRAKSKKRAEKAGRAKRA